MKHIIIMLPHKALPFSIQMNMVKKKKTSFTLQKALKNIYVLMIRIERFLLFHIKFVNQKVGLIKDLETSRKQLEILISVWWFLYNLEPLNQEFNKLYIPQKTNLNSVKEPRKDLYDEGNKQMKILG